MKQLSICTRCDALSEQLSQLNNAGKAGYCQITEDVKKVIDQVYVCTFLPGSSEKRFVRQMAAKEVGEKITAKQLMFLGQIRYRYRKQIEGK